MKAANTLEADFSSSQTYSLSPLNLKNQFSSTGCISDTKLDSTIKKSEKVKVYIRLRPFLEEEYCQNKACSIESFDTKNRTIQVKKDYERKCFSFDGIFEPKVTQNEIYYSVAKPSVLDGYNGTVLAYGQTGTGKTYSMIGTEQPAHKGIIPRALQDIFNFAEEDSSHVYSIQLSCIQIYMEMLQDLINPENKTARIRESPENGVFVAGVEWVIIQNVSEALQLLEIAEKNRAVAFTALNACSSRSHVILMVQVQKRNKTLVQNLSNSLVEYEGLSQTSESAASLVTSILYLVDLAGSERVKKSKSTGDRLHEAKAINSSLSALGKCIAALAEVGSNTNSNKNTFVPFRESKLTRLLQDSLGGNSKTSLIVTIGPSIKHIDETLSSLAFGQRAMRVSNKPVVNKQKDYYLLSTQLQQELDGKDDQIHEMEIQSQQMVKMIAELKGEVNRLQLDKQELEGSSRHLKLGLLSGEQQQNAVEFLEQQKKIEIELIENKYHEMLKKNESEYKVFLEDVDRTLLEQEEEIDSLKAELAKSKVNNDTQAKLIESLYEQIKQKDDELTSLENTYKNLETEKENNERDLVELQRAFKSIELAFREREQSHKTQFHNLESASIAERTTLIEERNKLVIDKQELLVSVQSLSENLKIQEDVVTRQNERRTELEGLLRDSQEEKAFMMQELEIKIDQLIEHNKRETAEFKAQLAEKSNSLLQLNVSYSELENKLNRVSEEFEEASEELSRKEDEFTELKRNSEYQINQLESALESSREQLKQLQIEFENTSQIMVNFQQSTVSLTNQLEQQLMQFEEQKTHYENVKLSDSENINQLQLNLEKQNEQLALKEQILTELQGQLAKSEQIVSTKHLQLESMQETAAQLKKEIEDHESKSEQLQRELAGKQSSLEHLKVKSNELKKNQESEILSLQSQNTQISALLSHAQEQIIDLNTSKQLTEDMNEAISAQIISCNNEIGIRDNLIEQLRSDIDHQLSRIADFEESSVSLIAQIRGFEADSSHLQQEILNRNQEIHAIRASYQNEKLEWTNQREQMKVEHAEKVNILHGSNVELNNLVETLQDNLNEVSVQNGEQSIEIERIQSKITAQTKEFAVLLEQSNRDKNALQQAVLKKDIAEEKIKILEQQMISKQLNMEDQLRDMIEQKQKIEQVLAAEIADKEAVIAEHNSQLSVHEELQKQLEQQIQIIMHDHALSSQELQQACQATVEDHCRSLEAVQAQKQEIEEILRSELDEKSQLIISQSEQLSAFIIQKCFRSLQRKQTFLAFLRENRIQKQTISLLAGELEDLRNQLFKSNQQLEYSNSVNSHQKETIDHIAAINASFGEKVSDQEEQIVQLLSERKAAQRHATESADRIIQLQVELEEKQQELSRKEEELGNSAEQLIEVKTKLKEYTGCIEALRQSLQVLEYQQAKEINESKIRNIKMTFQKQELRKEIENLTELNSELQAKYAKLIKNTPNVSAASHQVSVQSDFESNLPVRNRGQNKLAVNILRWFINRYKKLLETNSGLRIALHLTKKYAKTRMSVVKIQQAFRQSTAKKQANELITRVDALLQQKHEQQSKSFQLIQQLADLEDEVELNKKRGAYSIHDASQQLKIGVKDHCLLRSLENKENEEPSLTTLASTQSQQLHKSYLLDSNRKNDKPTNIRI